MKANDPVEELPVDGSSLSGTNVALLLPDVDKVTLLLLLRE
jgi:hypothetical protein